MEGGERQHLVGAAWRVLERSGFEGFKVQLVLREAGVSARAFYRHFADKDELMMALLQDEMARAGRFTAAIVDTIDDPVDQVTEWIRSMISTVTDPRRSARTRLFTSQQLLLRRYANQMVEAGSALHQPLLDAITRGAEDGTFPWADPARDAEQINALTSGKLIGLLMQEVNPDLEDIVADVAAFAMRALGLPPKD